MTDNIERLKQIRDESCTEHDFMSLTEAITEIERLRAEVKTLRDEYAEACCDYRKEAFLDAAKIAQSLADRPHEIVAALRRAAQRG